MHPPAADASRIRPNLTQRQEVFNTKKRVSPGGSRANDKI